MKKRTGWLTTSGSVAQALSTSTHSSSMCQTITKSMSQHLHLHLSVAAATEQPPHRPSVPKLDILASNTDEETQVEWEMEGDVKGRQVYPHEIKLGRQKEITNFVEQGGA